MRRFGSFNHSTCNTGDTGMTLNLNLMHGVG